jgi:hypothetical protein
MLQRTPLALLAIAGLIGCAKDPIVAPVDLPTRLRADVTMLATTFGERNIGYHPDALERAATWVESRLQSATGHEVKREPYACDGQTVRNLYVDLPGQNAPEEIVVIGAHYDSVAGSPGANDNASGVAAMLELAARFSKLPRARTIRFVAFVNEEPPHFQSPTMGSLVHANACRHRGEKVVGMIAFDTIGCFSDAPDSQRYPVPGINLVLPTIGNFIGVVGDLDRRAFVDRVALAMKRGNRVPVEGSALPGGLPGVGWSDHWSFWQNGYDAAMVTDTAPFRYAHYHQKTDTPDKIDYKRLAAVVDATTDAIVKLAEE